jgi:vancomycin aglycone glucosyltransferase
VRIVLAAFGSLGDVQPFVALGRGLRRSGHEVRLCGRAEAAAWVDLGGLDFFAVPGPARPAPPTGRHRPWFLRLHDFACAEAATQFAALSAAARGADLLLTTGSQLVASSVAEALGVRHRSVLLCPQMMPSARHPPLAVPWAAAPAALQRAGRRFHVELYNRAVRGPVGACRRRAGLAPLGDEFAANFLHHPIVACDPELGPIPDGCELAADQVGYLHAEEPAGELPADLERFLAAGPPPVYVGFGSTSPGEPGALTRLIVAAVAAAGCRAVVSRGWAGLGGEAAPRRLDVDARPPAHARPGNDGEEPRREMPAVAAVYFCGPVPHQALFPRVAAVLHHGGAGTTAAAARAGRPQVLLPPSLYDQAYWRQQVVERGIGLWGPRPRRLTVPGLASLLSRVVADAALARRAAALGEVLRRRDAVRDAVELLTAAG